MTAPGTGPLAEEVAGLDDVGFSAFWRARFSLSNALSDRITDLLSRSCGGGGTGCSSGSFNHGLSTKVPSTVLSWRDDVGAAPCRLFRLVLEASLCSSDVAAYQISSYYETVP